MKARLDVVDVARGLSLVAMAAYHFTWDLAYFGVVEAETPFTPPMRVASNVIGAAFLGLAGLSLALAHEGGFRRRAFLWRQGRIGAAAALVTAASYAVAPQTPIGFGILHCIFVASLVAVPVLIAPGPWPALALGLALVVAPALHPSAAFNPAGWVWLGLGTQEPATLDWRPLTPWGGLLVLGVGLARLAPRPPAWTARLALPRGLAWAGRHSLSVYLVHQPVLIALLYSALHVSGGSDRLSAQAYAKMCRPACVEAGGDIDTCDHACACVVRGASAAGLAGQLVAPKLAPSARENLGRIVAACGSDPR